MKLHPAIRLGMALTLCGFGFLAFVPRAHADEWDKMTILTINEPIQVRDTLLEPGSYVFKLADSSSDRHIVQIFNRNQSRLIDTIMAIPDYRVVRTGNTRFTFWETPTGSARALRDWFYPGDNDGIEFPYPKHLKQIAAVTTTVAPPPPPPAPVAEAPAPPPPPQPEAQVQTQPQQEEQTQVEIAQNNPPPPPPVEQAPPPAPQPETLPQTATPFALIALGGLLSLGVYGALRVQRLS